MRTRWVRIGVVAGFVLGLAACGSSAQTQSPGDLFHAYLESTNVVHDEFGGSATSADRMANFAAYGTPSDIESVLFTAFPCDDSPESGSMGGFSGQLGCPPNASVNAAAARFAGAGAAVYVRNVLIEHDGGQLELMPVYVVKNAAGVSELVDQGGQTYSGGLTDFAQNSVLVKDGDQILAPADVTATAQGGQMVVVPGHSAGLGTTTIVVIVGIAIVVLLGGWLVFNRVRGWRSQVG